MNAASAVKALKAKARPEKIAVYRNFFKTGPGEYGEGDRFIGVTVPDTRLTAEAFAALPMSGIKKLMASPVHEVRMLGLFILVGRYEKGGEKEKEAAYRFYLAHTRHVNNWDLVDGSAHYIVGPHLLNKSKAPLFRLARSKNLWERRVAIISTFHFIRQNRFEETLKLSEMLLSDAHDLMHKAVGWMLREVGKRDSRTLERFLRTHAHRMPRTALRYAIERFPETKRRAYLNRGQDS